MPAMNGVFLLTELFERVGEGTPLKPTLWCEYGYNIAIGHRTFVNSESVLLNRKLAAALRRHSQQASGFFGMPAGGNRVRVAAFFERRRKMHRYAKHIAR
jgi:hypothetical protein